MPVGNQTRALSSGSGVATTGLVFDIMRYALHDGPGIRTTVFFKGCPLSCWWCHNPESQHLKPERIYFRDRCLMCGTCAATCPQRAITAANGAMVTSEACRLCGTCEKVCPADAREIVGRWMTVTEVVAEIEKDIIFFDESAGGVTFSGGEPLMQPEFLASLLTACRERGLHTTVDTCGLAQRETLLRMTPDVDLFLFDLKLMDAERHERYAGVRNDVILENLQTLARSGRQVIVRFPVIPGVNDDGKNLAQMIAFLAPLGLRRVDLLPYHKIGMDKYHRLKMEYRLNGIEPPSDARMQDLMRSFQREGFEVRIGG